MISISRKRDGNPTPVPVTQSQVRRKTSNSVTPVHLRESVRDDPISITEDLTEPFKVKKFAIDTAKSRLS